MASQKIIPLILSGGSGSRLWPVSRSLYPKQLQDLTSEQSMLLETAERVGDKAKFASPIIICNEAHRFIIAEQFRERDNDKNNNLAPLGQLIIEPVGRNTAPAIAVGAMEALDIDDDALILALPADHLIRDQESFMRAIDKAAETAQKGNLVTFGIKPTRAETGYGYIQGGDNILEGAEIVAKFAEKPDAATAKEYVHSGNYYWNSGMFLMPAKLLLDEMQKFAPDVVTAAKKSLEKGQKDLDFYRLDLEEFKKSPAISMDYAVMEKTDSAAVVPCDLGWTDVGAWSELWEVGDKDDDGNVISGDVVTYDTKDSFIRADNGLIATSGLKNMVVISTRDVVMVADKNKSQDVKHIVDILKENDREEVNTHSLVYRPWGSYEQIDIGERYQVKRLSVKPGAILSLQKHFHRAEHWVVVNGTARVTRDDEVFDITENQSCYLPLGCMHRLENPGKLPLNIIEVQTGAYLGEDDIERFDDTYGRVDDKV